MLATLEGHNKQSVTGVALPFGSNKLYSGGEDKLVRVWDCNTGQCLGVVIMEGELGTLVSEGHWIFEDLRNAVKAWNIEGNTEMTLSGPVGEVYAIDVGNDIVFAGSEDGGIYVWKSGADSNSLELATSLKGHRRGVVSLIVGANRLYSGSRDHTIRACNLNTLQCIQTLNGHTDVVMSLLCWDSFLLSCSLDKTIKVWGANGDGKLKVIYTMWNKVFLLFVGYTMPKHSQFCFARAMTTVSTYMSDHPSMKGAGYLQSVRFEQFKWVPEDFYLLVMQWVS